MWVHFPPTKLDFWWLHVKKRGVHTPSSWTPVFTVCLSHHPPCCHPALLQLLIPRLVLGSANLFLSIPFLHVRLAHQQRNPMLFILINYRINFLKNKSYL